MIKKQVMVRVGNHIIDPTDVACITQVNKKGLYVVKLKSQPNMEFPIWVRECDISTLINQFNIILSE